MKNFKKYFYTFVLIFTCFIASPFIISKIWKTSKDKPVTYNNASSSSDITSTTNVEIVSTTTTTPSKPAFVFAKSGIEYFDDALFIGDSRTVGLYEYGNLQNADYFCSTGMSVYNLFSSSEYVKSIDKNTTLENLLDSSEYGKVYLMLGINELGYSFDKTIEKFSETVNTIRTKQPDAILYVMANLHVTKNRSDSDSIFCNPNIDKLNNSISSLADGKNIFYIDVNELFDDGHGNLDAVYTSDNAHVYAKHYIDWSNWLCTKTIVK